MKVIKLNFIKSILSGLLNEVRLIPNGNEFNCT